MLRREIQLLPLVPDSLHTRPEIRVQHDGIVVCRSLGSQRPGHVLERIIGVGAIHCPEHAPHPAIQPAALFQGHDGVLEGGRIGVGHDGVDLRLVPGHGLPERREIVGALDEIEGRHTEFGVPLC